MNRFKISLENLSKPQLLELAHQAGVPASSDTRKMDLIQNLLRYNKIRKAYA